MQSLAVKLYYIKTLIFFSDLELNDKKLLTDSDDDFELLWYLYEPIGFLIILNICIYIWKIYTQTSKNDIMYF